MGFLETLKDKSLAAPVDPYISWLQRENTPLFCGGGIAWRQYFGRVLIPASLRPTPVTLSRPESRALLRQSGTSLIRWFSVISSDPTPYWYVVCDSYDVAGLPGKMRTKIRRSQKDCEIRRIEPEWLAANGYKCYEAAFERYRHGRPIPRANFEKICRSCTGGPFTILGAFIGETLVGFAKSVVTSNYVAMVSFRIDPGHKSSRPAYALLDAVLRLHVALEGKTVGNGFLSLHDDTNMQDFVLQFGFKRVYCDLQLAYGRPLACVLNGLYPLRTLIHLFPSRGSITPLKSLLRQEQIRRSYVARR